MRHALSWGLAASVAAAAPALAGSGGATPSVPATTSDDADTRNAFAAGKGLDQRTYSQLNRELKHISAGLSSEQQDLLTQGGLSVLGNAYKVDSPVGIVASLAEFLETGTVGMDPEAKKRVTAAMMQALSPRLTALDHDTRDGASVLSKGQTTTGTGDVKSPVDRGTMMRIATQEGATPAVKALAVTTPGPASHAKVVTMATDAINGGVKDPEVFLVRGGAAEKLGDYQLANADAAYALRLDPANNVANSLYRLTRGRSSTVRLLDGTGIASDQAKASAAQGGTIEEQGGAAFGTDGATAEQIAAQENAALNARPVTARSAQLTRDAKSALRVRDVKSALRLTEEAIQADPGNADARYVRATAFLQMKEPARAAYEASAGLDLAPGNGPLLYTRAVANGRQRLWREAYVDAEDAVRNAPRAGYSYQVRAAANWALGRKAEMLQDLRTSASLDRAYVAAVQRATQLPSDVDPTLLFSDEPAPAAQAAPAAPAPAPRYALWAVGGVLAVLGLLPVFSSGVRSKVTTVFRRGPAVGEADPAGGADVPLTGFWKRYEVTREIGAGGMGVVYEAWDRQLERRVAVKRMRDEIRNDRRERERFLQEARMVARLRHTNLVEIYSIEEDGPDAYLVFEFVEGQNLHELLQEKGRFTPAEARDVFRGLCAGVDYAHRQGVVHRDLKPANVIVEPDGTVKVMDFGVARQAQDAMARRQMTNTIIGTPQYMAPEQEEGVVCTQSDVYALGVCLYEMLAGTPPFSGSAGAVTLAKRESRYEPLTVKVSDLPPAVARVVERALDPDPQTRTRTAADFLKDLEAAVSGVAA